jgi:ABC-2 type transport system permease protein
MTTGPTSVPFPFRLLRFYVGRILPGWALIGLFIFGFQIVMCGIVHDNQNVKALLTFMDVLPFLKRFFAGSNLTPDNTAGLIAMGHQHPLVLILFMVYAVGTPTSLLVGDIQRGTMELVLSRNVTKTQVFVCTAIPTVVGMSLLIFIMFLGTVAGTSLFHFDRPVPLFGFFQLAVNSALLASTVGTIALLIASFNRERGRAMMLSVGYLTLDYFINFASNWWPSMAFLRPWSLFHYAAGRKIFGDQQWPFSEMGILAGVATLALIAGWLIWRRRDLPG